MNNSETVASLGIMANDTLELIEEKEKGVLVSDGEEAATGRKPRNEGRAFGGTVLGGVARKITANEQRTTSEETVGKERHCPACTFINSDDATVCKICESNLDT